MSRRSSRNSSALKLRLITLGALIAWGMFGCSPIGPRFATSDRPPDPDEHGALLPLTPETKPVPTPGARMEETTARLFLALNTGNDDLIDSLLTSDALVRGASMSISEPARPALSRMTRELAKSDGAGTDFGNPGLVARTVELRAADPHPVAVVEVSGHEEMQGQWKLVFAPPPSPTRVRELILPTSN